MRRLPFLSALALGAALLAGCGTPPAASSVPSAIRSAPDEAPPPQRSSRPRWRGISDERPAWLRDLPERLERYRAPEDSTRASLASNRS
jgi:hypothetical protein